MELRVVALSYERLSFEGVIIRGLTSRYICYTIKAVSHFNYGDIQKNAKKGFIYMRRGKSDV